MSLTLWGGCSPSLRREGGKGKGNNANNQLTSWSTVQESRAMHSCHSVVKNRATGQCWPQSWKWESVLYTAVSSPTGQIPKDSKSRKLTNWGQGRKREGQNQDSITSGLTRACLVCFTLQKDARPGAFYQFLLICCFKILVWKIILASASLPSGVLGGDSFLLG